MTASSPDQAATMTTTAPTPAVSICRDEAREQLTLRLRDGRQLGYAQFGAADGHPVLCWHGAPASRLMYKIAHTQASQRGLRLIAFDRPGAGRTSPHPSRTLTARLRDAEDLVTHLNLARFALLGISGGGPYAAAMAAALGDRITALALVSPVGPLNDPDVTPKLSAPFRRLFLELPKRPRALRIGAAVARLTFLAAPALNQRVSARLMSRADRPILQQPWVRASLIEMTREAFRQSASCGVDDLTLYSEPWRIDLDRITAPTILWQGLADAIVPPISALTLGARIPGCDVRQIPGAGHFWVYDHMDEILETLQASIKVRTAAQSV
jgi:pimeloyl-ACP methyl ester carboxylesterase